MYQFKIAIVLLLTCAGAIQPTIAQEKARTMSHRDLFKKMQGNWEGEVKTWFQPGKLADQSKINGKIELVMGNFLRHTYTSTIKSKPRSGEELIGYDSIAEKYQVSWVDDFHMSQAITFSSGEKTATGFAVTGRYEVGKGKPAWGWRTEYRINDGDYLTITAYDISPTGEEAKALESTYQRKK